MPTVIVPSALRKFTGNESQVAVGAGTVREAIAQVEAKHPGFAAKVLDAAGVKPFIRVFVGENDIGLDTPVGATDEISIVPAIAGGR